MPPLAQYVVHVQTDAPLPNSLDAKARPGLFERALIDVYPCAAGQPCTPSTREIELTQQSMEGDGISLGVRSFVDGARVRVRIVHGALPSTGAPDPSVTLDGTWSLPPLAEGEVADVTVSLAVDSLGTQTGTLDAPIAPTSGAPVGPLPTWNGATDVPCRGAAEADEVCVRGGAFWMGDPLAGHLGFQSGDAQRLVVLSPFFLQKQEASTGELRAHGGAPSVTRDGVTDGSTIRSLCTFDTRGASRDTLPANCLSHIEARDYCLAIHRDLPTEAQWEFAASARGRWPFAWGLDAPACADAILSRGNFGIYTSFSGACLDRTKSLGVQPAGSGARDRVVLDTGTLLDTVGNLSEHVRDRWNRRSEPCWFPIRVFHDPLCTEPSVVDPFTEGLTKGGSWLLLPELARAASRGVVASRAAGWRVDGGVRCARPGS